MINQCQAQTPLEVFKRFFGVIQTILELLHGERWSIGNSNQKYVQYLLCLGGELLILDHLIRALQQQKQNC